ncbi:SAM-dependent methyltransferase [Phaeobacter inhibens]|uniref:SAM-dependent methyltransferase n=1 Tax=Phaeobacter inhibens TaxID=221822 RepID=UPI000C9AE84E|nr:cyclopropane-fatty-acyl-phospholipid synthase family protein [Phaeobacter inhibens]AUQ62417.1 cyclopropane-fatty-acyl-phospholipid synthase Cfa [Phaeobacter inhibens]AUQ82320.1 cyclopropane-fatty-acyl-phospholipid synthase Cfa [Phaeobacter inhibens]AUQ90081.1 cyclopropane-fatty-acyl-phospholipid synthase Cfa [Phaeobacter inhibens]MDO6755148.1 cyclopropane-fatty-acyl-phospholipid synthase family protein [Phaeobacter inhibens]
MALTTTDGQANLPRYFAAIFDQLHALEVGQLDIHLPDGRVFRVSGQRPGPAADLHIHNPDCFARLIREGDLGFSDAYLDGWWSTSDLQAFMDLIHLGSDTVYDGFPGRGLIRAYEQFRFWLQRNHRAQAKANISYHYDLGNAFYGLWLDDTMTYSSALFDTGQESLETAQTAKYASMVDQMGVKPGDHVLEVGCGWGGFAEYAARERGLRVTGLTISEEQLKYARERIEKAGLSDRVELRMQDYRDCEGTFDGIASIEMFEAVGEKYWPAYFNMVRDRLRPGGQATLQIITVADRRWTVYKRGVDFIQKHIFPGGMLPAPKILRQQVELAGLQVMKSLEFGDSYDQTLRRWHATFNNRWDEIAAMGFDDRFRKMWNFYLTSCAAAFKAETCDVTQITLAHR